VVGALDREQRATFPNPSPTPKDVTVKNKIPEDEMLLAEAIAAAKARGMKHTTGAWFRDSDNFTTTRRNAVSCCALGALVLAGRIRFERVPVGKFIGVAFGNDIESMWSALDNKDDGESLGWAFRQAMTASGGEEP
jgi:hypothetical protein